MIDNQIDLYDKEKIKLLKFDKLLGTGNIKYKYEIKANFATEKALQKIEQAGGKVILPSAKVAEEKVDI